MYKLFLMRNFDHWTAVSRWLENLGCSRCICVVSIQRAAILVTRCAYLWTEMHLKYTVALIIVGCAVLLTCVLMLIPL